MAKEVELKIKEIVKETKKAKFVLFDGPEYKSPVWLPNFRVEYDEEKGVVCMTRKLADEKLEDAKLSEEEKKEKRKEEFLNARNRPVAIRMDYDWENEKSVGIKVEIWNDYTSRRAGRGLVFFPKKMIDKNGCVPKWLFERKVADFLLEKLHPGAIDMIISNGNGSCGFVITNIYSGGGEYWFGSEITSILDEHEDY